MSRGKPAQIADRILALLADEELRTRFGRAGQEAAAAKVDLKRNVAQLIEAYGLGTPRTPADSCQKSAIP